MRTCVRLGASLLLPLLIALATFAQEDTKPVQSANGRIYLDVVVTAKSSSPVTGLQEKDFTILDNKAPQTIETFEALGGSQAPIQVVIVIDEVNADFRAIGFERDQVSKFLGANGGKAAFPTSISFFTDVGLEIGQNSSTDGNVLTASLNEHTVGLRAIRRSAGVYGAVERYQMSLKALAALTTHEVSLPGRKIIVWISPGWPLLSGPGIDMVPKQQENVFGNIVNLSGRMRIAGITLYSIDPLGLADVGTRTVYYKDFVKGAIGPSQVQLGDLGLQVLATQTGGLVLNASNDLANQLQACIADTQAYYEISFDPPLSDKVNEYHHVEVRLADKKLTARARQGYYAQPANRN